MLNIGWFSTGRDEAARQLLQAVQGKIRSGEIEGKISFVFSNRESEEAKESDLFFELVRSYDIPLICFSDRKYKSRLLHSTRNDKVEDHNDKMGDRTDVMGRHNDVPSIAEREIWRLQYDKEIEERIQKFHPDLCVLAGYMLIVGEEMCQKYNLLNLHPAPPGGPAGSWQEVIWTLIENKAAKAGAMMHLVTPDLDKGPVVSYCLFPIGGEPFARYWQDNDRKMLFQLIREHELAREFPLIISTLQSLGQGEISIMDGMVINAQGKPIDGYNLSAKIDRAVEKKLI